MSDKVIYLKGQSKGLTEKNPVLVKPKITRPNQKPDCVI